MASVTDSCVHCGEVMCEWEKQEEKIVDLANQWLFDDYGPDADGPPPNIVRKYYCRAYVLIRHSTVGANKRIIIPECVRRGVRALYPDPDGNYMGHKEK